MLHVVVLVALLVGVVSAEEEKTFEKRKKGLYTEVHVKSRVTCDYNDLHGIPIVTVLLWERDRGTDATVDSDDLLSVVEVPPNGTFYIAGGQTELGRSTFYIQVIHKCGGNCREMKIEANENVKTEYELKNQGHGYRNCPKKMYS